MTECFNYWIMQTIGYRKLHFDAALNRGIPLAGYEMWAFYPKWKKGTYREKQLGENTYVGYGTDK